MLLCSAQKLTLSRKCCTRPASSCCSASSSTNSRALSDRIYDGKSRLSKSRALPRTDISDANDSCLGSLRLQTWSCAAHIYSSTELRPWREKSDSERVSERGTVSDSSLRHNMTDVHHGGLQTRQSLTSQFEAHASSMGQTFLEKAGGFMAVLRDAIETSKKKPEFAETATGLVRRRASLCNMTYWFRNQVESWEATLLAMLKAYVKAELWRGEADSALRGVAVR